MFGMLDIIIALIFIYALFASLVSGINEIIVQIISMRGRILFEGIAMMLGELPRDTGPRISRWYRHAKRQLGFLETRHAERTNALYLHPLIDTLSPPDSSRPSYISPQTFSSALVQIMSADGTIDSLKKSLEDRSKPLNRLLGPMLDEADNDLQKFKQSVENHYNAVMDRVGGWYKRRMQFMMFIVGFLLAIGLNVDSIYIIQQFQKNPAQVQELVQVAADYSTKEEKADSEKTEQQAFADKVRQLNIDINDFKNLGLPIGWYISKEPSKNVSKISGDQGQTIEPDTNPKHEAETVSEFSISFLPGQNSDWVIFGWLATALAGALGAPFWFDAISKIFAARGSGRKPG